MKDAKPPLRSRRHKNARPAGGPPIPQTISKKGVPEGSAGPNTCLLSHSRKPFLREQAQVGRLVILELFFHEVASYRRE